MSHLCRLLWRLQEPYHVLVDGSFLHHALQERIYVKVPMFPFNLENLGGLTGVGMSHDMTTLQILRITTRSLMNMLAASCHDMPCHDMP